MKTIDLNGQWEMQRQGDDTWLAAQIPGSVASTLLAHGLMDDPFYRDNEQKVQHLFDHDYRFRRIFTVDTAALAHDQVQLHCDGLDTLATLTLNGEVLAETDNMHRTWVFDVKDKLKVGENTLSILFASPVKYLEAHPSQTGRKFAPIRKAACMFGWDWGLSLPDSGIWRDIYIETLDAACIDYVQTEQTHRGNQVGLKIGTGIFYCLLWVKVIDMIRACVSEMLFAHRTQAHDECIIQFIDKVKTDCKGMIDAVNVLWG